MKYKTENNYKLIFKDGTEFTSTGECNGLQQNTVKEELEWLTGHINLSLLRKNKTLTDLEKIEITIDFSESK